MQEPPKKSTLGRPEKPAEDRLSRKVTVAFTEGEYKDLHWVASQQLPENAKPSPKTDKAVAHFIRRLVLPVVKTFILANRTKALTEETRG